MAVSKIIDKTNCKDFYNFQGTIKISKIDKKIEYHFDGLASLYNSNNKLFSQFNYDSTGNFTTYQEFNEDGLVIYDCKYEYKMINNCLYRLEQIKLYYKPNFLFQDGWRFVKLKNKNGKNCSFTFNHKFGKWTYYYDDGTVKENIDYGEIK